MKTSRVCPKCGFGRILHVEEVADRTGGTDHDADRFIDRKIPEAEFRATSCAWRIARKTRGTDTFLGTAYQDRITGLVEAYICRRCGFTEFYTLAPESLSTEDEGTRELVGPEGTPFR